MAQPTKTRGIAEPTNSSTAPAGTIGLSDNAKIQLGRAGLIIGILALWQFGSGRFFDPFFFSSPVAIANRLWIDFNDWRFYYDFYVTAVQLFSGYAIGAVLGVSLGVLLARWPLVAQIFDPLLIALNAIPRIALAPLLIIWLGIDMASKIVLAATLVFFLTFFNTLSGIRNVDAGLINVARVQGASDRQIFTKVMLPGAASWIMTGLKLSLPFALIGVIVGEFMAAAAGLGYRLNFYTTSYNTSGTFAMLFVLMAFMMTLNTAVNAVERRVLKWRPKSAFQAETSI